MLNFNASFSRVTALVAILAIFSVFGAASYFVKPTTSLAAPIEKLNMADLFMPDEKGSCTGCSGTTCRDCIKGTTTCTNTNYCRKICFGIKIC